MTWIKDNLIMLLAIALASVLVAGGLWIAGLKAHITTLQAEVKSLEADIRLQSAAVDAWRIKAEAQLDITRSAQAVAAKWRKRANTKADAIFHLPLPKEECHALQTLIDAARDVGPDGLPVNSGEDPHPGALRRDVTEGPGGL